MARHGIPVQVPWNGVPLPETVAEITGAGMYTWHHAVLIGYRPLLCPTRSRLTDLSSLPTLFLLRNPIQPNLGRKKSPPHWVAWISSPTMGTMWGSKSSYADSKFRTNLMSPSFSRWHSAITPMSASEDRRWSCPRDSPVFPIEEIWILMWHADRCIRVRHAP